jgi:aspartyl aminopeptidase
VTDLDDLIGFLAASPSPWHAVASSAARLSTAGYTSVDFEAPWNQLPARGYVVRGAALVAWNRGTATDARSALRVVGAHTDSPGLRVKPRPDTGGVGWKQLGVEVYGGLINSWLDRDLGVAGRVELSMEFARHRGRRAICDAATGDPSRRDVNNGLILDKQQHLTPMGNWATNRRVRRWLNNRLATQPTGASISWDLCLFDPRHRRSRRRSIVAGRRSPRQPGVVLGGDRAICTVADPGPRPRSSRCSITEVGSECHRRCRASSARARAAVTGGGGTGRP